MSRTALALLMNIDANVSFVLDILRGRTASHLTNDLALRYAVQHALLLISAAVHRLPSVVRTYYPDASWEFFDKSVDDLLAGAKQPDFEKLWDFVHAQLPRFQVAIRNALHQAREGVLPLA